MAFDAGKKGGVRSDINITPLVDVVLVLLIIFMVMTPLMLKDLPVNVPQKADTQLTPPPVTVEQVVLHIDDQGKIDINKEPVSEDELANKVRNVYANRREKIMFFNVDDKANYGFTTHIMDICRGAGVKVLGIMTKT